MKPPQSQPRLSPAGPSNPDPGAIADPATRQAVQALIQGQAQLARMIPATVTLTQGNSGGDFSLEVLTRRVDKRVNGARLFARRINFVNGLVVGATEEYGVADVVVPPSTGGSAGGNTYVVSINMGGVIT